MEFNKDTNVADVTLAEIHAALFNTEKEFYAAVKNMKFKEAIQIAKRYMELNNLLLKRSNYVRKNNSFDDSLAGVQQDVARTVNEIMDEKGRSK